MASTGLGSIVGSGLRQELPFENWFREGHGFSRAAQEHKEMRASAPEGTNFVPVKNSSFLSNETRTQRTERGGNTAVVHCYGHMYVLLSIFEQLNLNLVFLAFRFDLVGLYICQFRQKLRTRLRTPLLNLRIQYRPPLLSTFH